MEKKRSDNTGKCHFDAEAKNVA